MNDVSDVAGTADSRMKARGNAALRKLRQIGLASVASTLDDPAARERIAANVSEAIRPQFDQLLADGREAIENIPSGASAKALMPDSIMGLEAIVVAVGRPALLVRDDDFEMPSDPWTMLEAQRASIRAVLPSAGRIDLVGHPSLDWVGTGFMIAPGVVMTNRHVVQEFASRSWSGRWSIDEGISVRIDFGEEIGETTPRDTPIGEVIAVHPNFDVALLSCQPLPGHGPLPLDGGSVPVAPNRTAYIVGYPAIDSRRNDSMTLERVFGSIFNVKRLQPGRLTGWLENDRAYMHDCSTLGGNSGSCLVDLETGIVLGIHFGGRFGQANWAVSMRDLVGEPLLRELGAHFV